MAQPTDSVLLRIFTGESVRVGHRPVYEVLIDKAREQHLSGATVLRCVMGFGRTSHLHTSKVLRLSDDLPIVIEIVDTEEKIAAFMPVVDRIMPSGMATLEKVRAYRYGPAVTAVEGG